KVRFISQIKASEEKYRLLVENQTDMVVKVDAEGRFLYVSPSYCRMFGKKQSELLGEKFMPLVHEDDIDGTLKEMEKLRSPSHNCYIEQRAMTTEGWKWLSWTDTAIIDSNGKIMEIIGVGRDISKEKEAEIMLKETNLKLAENELKYRSLFENAPVPFQSLDEEGNIIDVNSVWLINLGYYHDDVIGKWFGDFLHPDFVEHFRKNFPKFKEAGYISDVQFQMKKKDGSFIYVSFEGKIGYGQDGSVEKTYCVFRNITEIQKAESDLAAKVKELEEINSTMVNREIKMIELKKEINQLLKELGRTEKYDI
ncbi:MAG: PAS domain S-box protein, partial [Candidatus Delongbacteria bacterium]|nr:PAS domain S-box protein [Candidatus Delongbacteria bacterium]